MRIIEELMNRRWILKSQDPQLYYEIKDNAKELKKKLQEKFGYALIINPYLVKLEKIPGKAEGWMGITEFETLMEYQMFCYLLMLLEDKEAGERFILSNICEFIQVQFPKGELEWTSLRARRQLVRVLQYALKMGMIISREGDEDYFLKDETSDILYENTGVSRYFIRNIPKDIMDFHEPEDFLQSEWFDMEEDRGIVRRQRIYRRLMLSCGVYHTAGEDKDDDFGYIRNNRRNIENDFQSLFPCQLHVHSSSAFLVLEEDCSMGKVFPKTHAYYDLLLIVHDDLRKRVKTSRLSLDQHEGITLRLEEYLAIVQRLIKKNNALLPKKYQIENRRVEDSAMDVCNLAQTLGFAQVQQENVYIYPVAGKITGTYAEVTE